MSIVFAFEHVFHQYTDFPVWWYIPNLIIALQSHTWKEKNIEARTCVQRHRKICVLFSIYLILEVTSFAIETDKHREI